MCLPERRRHQSSADGKEKASASVRIAKSEHQMGAFPVVAAMLAHPWVLPDVIVPGIPGLPVAAIIVIAFAVSIMVVVAIRLIGMIAISAMPLVIPVAIAVCVTTFGSGVAMMIATVMAGIRGASARQRQGGKKAATCDDQRLHIRSR